MTLRFPPFAVVLIIFAALIFALLTLFAYGSRATAQPLDAHPWYGVTRICIASPEQGVSCADFRSPLVYDTNSACEADMTSRLARTYELFHSQHPDWQMQSQFVCRPDLTQEKTRKWLP